MGNVQASSVSGSPPPSPPLTAHPLTTTPPDKIIPTRVIENPGTFEELHNKCKGRLIFIIQYIVDLYHSFSFG